nr:MAG TPA: hypothetical protein [Caudoviricetes sp.]
MPRKPGLSLFDFFISCIRAASMNLRFKRWLFLCYPMFIL